MGILKRLLGLKSDSTQPSSKIIYTPEQKERYQEEMRVLLSGKKNYDEGFANQYRTQLNSEGLALHEQENILTDTYIEAKRQSDAGIYRGEKRPKSYCYMIAHGYKTRVFSRNSREREREGIVEPPLDHKGKPRKEPVAPGLPPDVMVIDGMMVPKYQVAFEEIMCRIEEIENHNYREIIPLLLDSQLRRKNQIELHKKIAEETGLPEDNVPTNVPHVGLHMIIAYKTGLPEKNVPIYVQRARAKFADIVKTTKNSHQLDEDFDSWLIEKLAGNE